MYNMANIKVDLNRFEEAASAIESYILKHKNKMSIIDQSVNSLGSSWRGSDYTQFKKEWQQINGLNSTSDKMLKSLDNYADLLRFIANKYRSAQLNAEKRANSLPRY